jgi:hypothetical protein
VLHQAPEPPAALASLPCLKPALQEVPELPRDWTQLFDAQLYALDMRHVPEAVSSSSSSPWGRGKTGLVQQTARQGRGRGGEGGNV